jgi:hypothetical protein
MQTVTANRKVWDTSWILDYGRNIYTLKWNKNMKWGVEEGN